MARQRVRGPGCLAFGRGVRHSLAFVHTLHRRCVINRESHNRVASQLSLDRMQVAGVVRLLKSISYIPSFERLAVIAQRDPGLDDDDIGEIFGTTPEWSASVRERADELRLREPIPMQFEVLTEFDCADDESLVLARAAAIRESRPLAGRGMESNRTGNIRSFAWRHKHATFVHIGVD